MTALKPGRIFWISTAIADLRTPGTGRHRINDRLEELYRSYEQSQAENHELTTQNRWLRHELAVAEGKNNLFLHQDEMNAALAIEPVKEPHLLVGSNSETTLPMHMLGAAMAKASLGMPTGSENPAAIPVN